MTLQELVEIQENNRIVFISILAALPVLALIVGLAGGKSPEKGVTKYLFSLLVYAASLPGMLSLAACVHLFFVEEGDFFQADLLVYFLPIGIMIATLSIINRFLSLDKVPGFGRIWGLLMISGILGLFIFFLNRTFIGVIFFGNIWTLIGLLAILVVLFMVGGQMLFGKRQR